METASSSIGYVISWTYHLAEYSDAIERFHKGKRKRPPQPLQMWVATAEIAEKIKQDFLTHHPNGGIKIEPGSKPKRQSMMMLSATVTHTRTEVL